MTNPADAREALGARLRELRRTAGITGRALADQAGWGESKVSKIENGRQTPSSDDLRAYCAHTGTPDQLADLLATLHNVETAVTEWRKVLGTGTQRQQKANVRLAEESEMIRIYQPQIIPGILQTAEYAAAVLRRYVEFYRAPDDVDQGVAARIERQQLLYSGRRKFHILVAEQALHTTVGDDAVMVGQLDRLLAVAGLSRVLLGIIPAKAEMPIQATNFVVFDQRLVTVEAITAELRVTQPREIAVYLRAFDGLVRQAVTGERARTLIRRAMETRPPGTA
ncbi:MULTISPECIES: helix-turn-helix domain-containing protein [unclassified Nocardia]|uniref:helix-turn-helix domain-containing protein n=1 Tax=unclassified Nocardia TaxID=2637762 RepID=UPI0033BE2F86